MKYSVWINRLLDCEFKWNESSNLQVIIETSDSAERTEVRLSRQFVSVEYEECEGMLGMTCRFGREVDQQLTVEMSIEHIV